MSETKTRDAGADERNLLAVGSWLAIGAGLGLFGIGLWACFVPEPPPTPLIAALTVCGFLNVVLGWFSMRMRRLAWAFCISLNGTLAAVFMFTGPRLRELLGSNLLIAEAPAFVFAAIAAMLVISSPLYDSRDPGK